LKRLETGVEPARFEADLFKRRPMVTQRRRIEWVTFKEVYDELPDWSKNRLRYHYNSGQTIPKLDTPARTIAYGIYRQALVMKGLTNELTKWDVDQLAYSVEGFKKLSEYMKKFGEDVAPKTWRYFVDMHRLNDYIEPPPTADFKDDIRDWVQRKTEHTWNGDEEEWYRRFEIAMRTVLFRSGKRPGEITTVDDFINNGDIWCTAGSGFEPTVGKLHVYDRERKDTEEVKKNKWSVRWEMSNYKTKRLLFKKRVQICKAVAKSEPAKVRAVISSDLGLYLKMTYISLFLDQILAGRTDSTLWMNGEDRFKLWQSMAFDGTWRMPLDQSEFDRNQSKRQVLITVRLIKELIKYYGATDTMLEIMDLIIFSLEYGYVIVDGERIDYTNGVLSGWRWTAMLDTLINLAEVELAQDWVRENSSIDPGVISVNAQGDDDWFKFKTRRGAIAVWLAYESFGLFVNPGKFFLSTVRDEYLRRVYDNGVVTGYPARSVASIMFRNPVSEKEPVGSERIRSTFGKWKLFAERMDVKFKNSWWWRRFLQDCVQGTRGVTKQMIEYFVEVGAVYGGIGLDNGPWLDVLLPAKSRKVDDHIEILGEGFKEWSTFAQGYGVTARAANNFAASTLDLAGKYGWPDWVKYVYTFDQLDGIEHGLRTDRSGTIAVGKRTKYIAWKLRWRWFPTVTAAKAMTHWVLDDAAPPRYFKKYDNISLHRVGRTYRLSHVEGISQTLAQLSEEPGLVWKDYNPEIFAHKPKSWVKDFLAGRLKGSAGPRSGWGADVVGHFSKIYLRSAIEQFLYTNRPSMRLWDSLLAGIEAAVSIELSTLPVRVVE